MNSKTSGSRRLRDRVTAVLAGTGVATLLAGLVVTGTAGTATAAGNNGTLKVLNATSNAEFVDNEPKVCQFKFEGFFFDAAETGDVTVSGQGLTSYGPVTVDAVTANSSGYFITPVHTLAAGHYKVEFKNKFKVFKVRCDAPDPVPDQVTPAYPHATAPGCDVAGRLVVPEQPAGVTVVRADGDNDDGPGTYTFEYAAADGYVLDGDDEVTVSVLPAVPRQSTDSEAACYVKPGDQPVKPEIAYEDPCGTKNDTVDGVAKDGYTFDVDELAGTVTFTPKEGYYLDGSATLEAPWTDKPCDEGPGDKTVKPEITWSDPCGTTHDTVDGVVKEGYTFDVDHETGWVTFTAKDGYVLAGSSELRASWSDDPCPAKATPTDPEIEPSEACDVEGTFSIPDTWGVEYLLDDEPIDPGTYEGPVEGKLTAEPIGDTLLTEPAWHYDLDVEPAEPCADVLPGEITDVCPNLPEVQEAVPSGYTLVQDRCVEDTEKGVEHERPESGPGPTVAPAAAADRPGGAQVLPTAVDAGLPAPLGTVTETPVLLGQGLVAGGLLMLLVAGSLSIGRRGRGVHQA